MGWPDLGLVLKSGLGLALPSLGLSPTWPDLGLNQALILSCLALALVQPDLAWPGLGLNLALVRPVLYLSLSFINPCVPLALSWPDTLLDWFCLSLCLTLVWPFLSLVWLLLALMRH